VEIEIYICDICKKEVERFVDCRKVFMMYNRDVFGMKPSQKMCKRCYDQLIEAMNKSFRERYKDLFKKEEDAAEEKTFEYLIGKTIIDVHLIEPGNRPGTEDRIRIFLENGERFMFWHCHECCEDVYIDNIDGDLEDLIGVPLLTLERTIYKRNESPPGVNPPDLSDCLWIGKGYTWTIYKFETSKGSVVVRWLGISNGRYSERVDFTALLTLEEFRDLRESKKEGKE
jgi:hypothetical protein